jgi:hypothetical protein
MKDTQTVLGQAGPEPHQADLTQLVSFYKGPSTFRVNMDDVTSSAPTHITGHGRSALVVDTCSGYTSEVKKLKTEKEKKILKRRPGHDSYVYAV